MGTSVKKKLSRKARIAPKQHISVEKQHIEVDGCTHLDIH